MVYLVNLSEKAYTKKKSKWLPKIFEWVQAHGGEPIIPFSGAYEARLFDMPDDEKAKAVEEAGAPSALPKIIQTGFKAIQLIYFFTAGDDEVKCWQIRRGAKAPQAAGTIHTDFERGFICAEVMKYDELVEAREGAGDSAGWEGVWRAQHAVLGSRAGPPQPRHPPSATPPPTPPTPVPAGHGVGGQGGRQVPPGGQELRGQRRRRHLFQVQRHGVGQEVSQWCTLPAQRGGGGVGRAGAGRVGSDVAAWGGVGARGAAASVVVVQSVG